MRALALALSLLVPGAALAWGEAGHRMVGAIADLHLNASAAREVAFLLGRDRLADRTPSGRRTLAAVAYWADEIKDYPWGKSRGSWHYDNVPVCGEADPARYCRKGSCASAQLARQIAILGDRGQRPRERNEALKWVVHLMGDIHQPLHAADHRDQGGNRVEVAFFGARDNAPYGTIRLHTIWDIHIVDRLVADRRGEAAIVSARMTGAQKAQWEQGSIADWMRESHEIARDFVYPALPAGFACGRKIDGVVAIGDDYYARAAPIVEERIRKAGIRLARVINETIGR
jgi:S1/P1 Nuclease